MKTHLLLKSFEDLPADNITILGMPPAQAIGREDPGGILDFQGPFRAVDGGQAENSNMAEMRKDTDPDYDSWIHGGLNE